MAYLNPEIRKNLTLYLKTKKRALKTLDELEKIESNVFSGGLTSVEFYEKFTQKLELGQKEIISFLLNDVLDGKFDKVSVEKVTDEFSEYIKNVEILHLTLPVEPSEKLMNKLFDWLVKNFAADEIFLLDYEEDDTLFAGLKVSYKGKFYDLSLDAKIEAFLRDYQFS